jgi:hypothetical protein
LSAFILTGSGALLLLLLPGCYALQSPCSRSQQPQQPPEPQLQPQSQLQQQQQRQQQQQQQLESCSISVPAQVTLLPGSTAQQALQQLAAAGIALPALVKPLSSMPSDSARVGSAAAAAVDGNSTVNNPASGAAAAAAVKAAVADGHALGVLLEEQGVQQLLDGLVPELALPVVVQQFVPHGEALYKVMQLA